ncbi:MAG: response regulator transcription factor [Eggerthella lenta]
MGTAAGLTDREQEIFEYLARRRNVRFIQDELTVSYNTVKTHVSHIYAKLDVHSHQELIDLVERQA